MGLPGPRGSLRARGRWGRPETRARRAGRLRGGFTRLPRRSAQRAWQCEHKVAEVPEKKIRIGLNLHKMSSSRDEALGPWFGARERFH